MRLHFDSQYKISITSVYLSRMLSQNRASALDREK